MAAQARRAGGLLVGGPNGCVWTNNVLPWLRCTRDPDHFVTQMGSAQAAYNGAELSELSHALREIADAALSVDDAAFVADVDGGRLGPYAIINAMARRLWKTPEAAAVVPNVQPSIAKRRRMA